MTTGPKPAIIHFDSPIADLGADERGPFWCRPGRNFTLFVEELTPDNQTGLLATYNVDRGSGHLPCLMADGSREPLYRQGRFLWHGAQQFASLGAHEWEHYAAALTPSGLFVRAFHTGDTAADPGKAYAALLGSPGWTTATMPIALWAPVARARGSTLGIVRRTSDGIEVETLPLASLPSAAAWAPTKTGQHHPGQGAFFGDPALALAPDGTAHWTACLWQRTRRGGKDWSCQMHKVYLDGHELIADAAAAPCLDGVTTPAALQWTPALEWVDGMGLVLAWQSRMPQGADLGEVTVALAGNIGGPGRRTFPGFQPRLASSGSALYLATSAGLWSNQR